MKPFFKNPQQEKNFQKNGYLLLSALDQGDIVKLIELYDSLGLKDEAGFGFHVGIDNKDKLLVSKMVDRISEIALPKIQNYFCDSELLIATFAVKEPNPNGVVNPHQDWSFVEDEKKYCSVTCWIPLNDVNIDNGCMGLIKGSNHFFNNIRPSPPLRAGSSLTEHNSNIFSFLEFIEMKAGEILVFNSKTIHASLPNFTNSCRTAIVLVFVQKAAEKIHYYLKPGDDNKVLKYKITSEFFLNYNNPQLSELYDKNLYIEGYGEPEEIQYTFEKISAEEFIQKMKNAGNTNNILLENKLSELYDYRFSGIVKEDNTLTIKSEFVNKQKKPTDVAFWKIYTPLNILREIKSRISRVNLFTFAKHD